MVKKGNIPWNKGLKLPETSGSNNPHWKGGRIKKTNCKGRYQKKQGGK